MITRSFKKNVYISSGNAMGRTTVAIALMKETFVLRKRVPISNSLAKDPDTAFRNLGFAMEITVCLSFVFHSIHPSADRLISVLQIASIKRMSRIVHLSRARPPNSNATIKSNVFTNPTNVTGSRIVPTVRMNWDAPQLGRINARTNNSDAKSPGSVFHKLGIVMEPMIARTNLMSPNLVGSLIANRTTSNATTPNASTRALSAMAKTVSLKFCIFLC